MKTILALCLLLPILANEMELDPFKELGIPQVSMGGDVQTPKKEEIPRLETIDDLPAFVESSYFNTRAGVNMLTKFLTEDDDQLKENGGIFDQTGFDGLDKSEDIYPKNTEMRLKQRARSAVNLFTKQTEPDSKYEAYGCIDPDDSHKQQSAPGWLSFTVLLMTPLGDHKMQSVCLPDTEKTNIVFVSATTDIDCNDKSKVSQEIRDRTKKYFEKSGLGQKIQERLGIDIFEDYKDDVVKTPPQQTQAPKKTIHKTKEITKDTDDVSDLKRQIQELQSKLTKAVSRKTSSMRFKQKETQPNEDNEEQKDNQEQENKDKDEDKDKGKEKQEDQDKEKEKEKEDVNEPSEKVKKAPVPVATTESALEMQTKMMMQMQKQFEQHDELMQNEIKLLKEEVNTMKNSQQTKNQRDDQALMEHYKQKSAQNKDLSQSIASMLTNKIRRK